MPVTNSTPQPSFCSRATTLSGFVQLLWLSFLSGDRLGRSGRIYFLVSHSACTEILSAAKKDSQDGSTNFDRVLRILVFGRAFCPPNKHIKEDYHDLGNRFHTIASVVCDSRYVSDYNARPFQSVARSTLYR